MTNINIQHAYDIIAGGIEAEDHPGEITYTLARYGLIAEEHHPPRKRSEWSVDGHDVFVWTDLIAGRVMVNQLNPRDLTPTQAMRLAHALTEAAKEVEQ